MLLDIEKHQTLFSSRCFKALFYRPRVRFEDTDRWVRGRVVAALAAGDELPAVEPARLERALNGLVHDGLVQRDGGVVRLG